MATSWRVGTGVTGTAYKRKEFLVGQGAELKPGGRYGPLPGQSPHLQEYRTVIAQPIISASEALLKRAQNKVKEDKPVLDALLGSSGRSHAV